MENQPSLFAPTRTKSSKGTSGPAEEPLSQLKIEGPHEFKETVLNRVRDTLAECENGDMMSADVDSDCDV